VEAPRVSCEGEDRIFHGTARSVAPA
jgi:hypothetical protein